jgi:hypothetical protein
MPIAPSLCTHEAERGGYRHPWQSTATAPRTLPIQFVGSIRVRTPEVLDVFGEVLVPPNGQVGGHLGGSGDGRLVPARHSGDDGCRQ